MEKMAALHCYLIKNGLLKGTTSSAYMNKPLPVDSDSAEEDRISDSKSNSTDNEDNVNTECLPVYGEPDNVSLTEVKLAAMICKCT
jgi:hypothetical protein